MDMVLTTVLIQAGDSLSAFGLDGVIILTAEATGALVVITGDTDMGITEAIAMATTGDMPGEPGLDMLQGQEIQTAMFITTTVTMVLNILVTPGMRRQQIT